VQLSLISHLCCIYTNHKSIVINIAAEMNVLLVFRTSMYVPTLESSIDVGQGITVGPGKFVKKNKCRALYKRRA
jgi:hypothetical protein